MTTFFTADPHFSHRRIIELTDRPFTSVEEMDEQLVERWNAVVGHTDVVHVLGDLALGEIDDSLSFVGRLYGTKHLMAGNHDRCFTGARPTRGRSPGQWAQIYQDAGFASVDGGAAPLPLLLSNGREVVLSHFPSAEDLPNGVTDRYGSYRPLDADQVLLHGHVHTAWEVRRRTGLEINVGVDAWNYAPVSEQQIEEVIRKTDAATA